MTTTSSVSSSNAPSISTGNAQDVSGLTSGSVSLSLAEAVSAKVQPYLDDASAIQTDINTNNTQIAAYQNMQSLLQALQSAAANLTTESLQGSNVFQSRAADLTSNSSLAPSSVLTAAVANGTAVGAHTVVVNQLAQPEADTSATLALTSTTKIGTLSGSTFNGSITIAENGKSSPQAVTISPTMTLAQVASAINSAAPANGVTASVVTVDSGHQVLVLSAQDADTPLNFTDSNNILQALGVVSGSSPTTMTGTVADPTVAAGSFTVHAGNVAAQITTTAGESLASIAAAMTTAGIPASVYTDASNNNFLRIDGTGKMLSFSDMSGNALSSLGLAPVALNQVTAAQALNLTVDGVKNITRNTNTVADVVNGVTLNVTHADPNTTITVNINPNANTAATAIQSFVTAYNSWESFVEQNEATDSSGKAAANAVLFGDSSLRDASLQVDSALTQEINGTSLGALGISFNNANQMVLDSTTLDDALNNNFMTVANLFQATSTSDSINLQASGSNLSTFAGKIKFDITVDPVTGGITGLQVNGGSAAGKFTFSGNTISGTGAYAGLYFNYSGPGETVNVTSTQGLANQLYTVTDNFGSQTRGSIQSLIANKQQQNLQFTSQYNSWISTANNYADFLISQYSTLTTQIQTAGQTLNTLTALMNADNRN